MTAPAYVNHTSGNTTTVYIPPGTAGTYSFCYPWLYDGWSYGYYVPRCPKCGYCSCCGNSGPAVPPEDSALPGAGNDDSGMHGTGGS